MWIFTPEGFLSAVQDKDNDQLVRVRARTERHIAQFADACEQLDGHPHVADIVDMETVGNYDYRWVLTVPRDTWNSYLITVELPTGHVKEHVSRVDTDSPDQEMYTAMLDIWTRMYRLQSGVKRKFGEPTLWGDDIYDSKEWQDYIDGVNERQRIKRADPFADPRFDRAFRPTPKPNPFVEAARNVQSAVAHPGESRLAVEMNDGEIVMIDVEYDPAETDEWYETKVLPAVKAKGYDTDLIDDFYAIDDDDDFSPRRG
jgi:hypothetical protein